jgi:hypothetical protein
MAINNNSDDSADSYDLDHPITRHLPLLGPAIEFTLFDQLIESLRKLFQTFPELYVAIFHQRPPEGLYMDGLSVSRS